MKKVWIIVFGLSYLGVSAQKKWSLKECVSYAVEHNLQVIQNQYTKQSQEYNLKMAKKEYLPSVSGNMTNGVSFGQASLGTGSIRNDRFNNSVSIMADMMIYNNGRIEKTVRKAQFDVEASQYDIETIKNDISLQIAQQYLTALLNKEIVKISQSAVENAKKQADRAKITTQVGTTAQTVLAEAEAALAREKQNLKTAEVNVGRALFAIAQLLQLTDYKDFDVEDVNVPETLDSQLTTADEVLKTAYEIQPQIKAAESRIRAAEAQTEVNKTSFWPSLSASAGLSTFYNNLLNNSNLGGQQNSFFQQYDDNFGQNVGLSLRIPILIKELQNCRLSNPD